MLMKLVNLIILILISFIVIDIDVVIIVIMLLLDPMGWQHIEQQGKISFSTRTNGHS